MLFINLKIVLLIVILSFYLLFGKFFSFLLVVGILFFELLKKNNIKVQKYCDELDKDSQTIKNHFDKDFYIFSQIYYKSIFISYIYFFFFFYWFGI